MINLCAVKKMGQDVLGVLIVAITSLIIVSLMGFVEMKIFHINPIGNGILDILMSCLTIGGIFLLPISIITAIIIGVTHCIGDWYNDKLKECKPRRKK
jgi:hypothetical protein